MLKSPFLPATVTFNSCFTSFIVKIKLLPSSNNSSKSATPK